MNRILNLVATEARIELRERSALSGIVLYVLSSAFIVFSIWKQLPPKEWGLTFWVIFLFCSLMAVLKTFGRESEGRYFYYYTLYHPLELFAAKVIYNLLLLVFIFLCSLVCLVCDGRQSHLADRMVFRYRSYVCYWPFFSVDPDHFDCHQNPAECILNGGYGIAADDSLAHQYPSIDSLCIRYHAG